MRGITSLSDLCGVFAAFAEPAEQLELDLQVTLGILADSDRGPVRQRVMRGSV